MAVRLWGKLDKMRDAGGIGRAQARIGSVLDGKWRLDTLLGVGGSAAVYAATHRNTKRAAVKILHPELSTHAELVARFVREGYVANKIGHAGTVTVLDDDRAEDGSCYLVMELLDGHSLDRYTRPNEPPMPLREIVRLIDDLLDVLASAHKNGIIHRDIKPANLFLTQEQKLKVLDFGIARLAEPYGGATSTQTGMTIGTPSFMPPEQARGRWHQIDPRTDIWAVGATMFALVTQKRPRDADTPNEELLLAMTTPVEATVKLAPWVPPEIAHVIDKAVSMDMDGRWPDACTMQNALREARRAIEARGVDLTLPFALKPPGAPQTNTIQIGDPSSAPLVPRAKLTPPPKSSPSAPTPSPVVGGDRLTTGSAFLHSDSQTPPARPKRSALFVGLVFGVLWLGIIGFAASHYIGAKPTTTTPRPTPAASPPPHADPIPPPEPVQDTAVADPAPPSTGSARPVTPPATTTKPPSTAIGRPPTPPGAHKPPQGGKSTDPFDQRF
jgi:serine/threonine-protein kinase